MIDLNEAFARRSLTEFCKLLYDRKLTVSAGGNMSVRLNGDEFLITPSGVNKGLLNPENLIKMDLTGRVLGHGKPSIEHRFHLELYKANPAVGAIVHCHPLYCLALSVRGEPLRTCLTPEGVLLLGKVPTVRYETPGSEELVQAVLEHAASPAMLMAQHGALTQGKNLEEAYDRMEELEFQAHLQLLAGRDAPELPAAEIAKLEAMRG